MTKLLIVVRHVECMISGPVGHQVDGPFAEGAEQQARNIAERIREIIRGIPAKLLTSDAKRCIMTAETMKEILGLSYYATDRLNLAYGQFQDVLVRLLAGKGINTYGAYILLTHHAFVRQALMYAKEELKYASSATEHSEIPYGSFIVVNCEDKSVTEIWR